MTRRREPLNRRVQRFGFFRPVLALHLAALALPIGAVRAVGDGARGSAAIMAALAAGAVYFVVRFWRGVDWHPPPPGAPPVTTVPGAERLWSLDEPR